MRLHPAARQRRNGFTLIEMMVVIGIIAILVSLLTSAIIMALHKIDETRARNEITQLQSGVVQFQTDYGLQSAPPPSRLYIDESGTYNPVLNYPGYNLLNGPQQLQLNQMAADSKAYLQKVWPRTSLAYVWNQTRVLAPNPYILEGEYIYVFFLGGLIVNGVPVGFSTSPTDPMASPAANPARKGPYFQFVQGRLAQPVNALGYALYYDAFSSSPPIPATDKPYLYFSSGGKANGYNPYPAWGSDCISFNVWPFLQGPQTQNTPALYYQPDKFQIVCAGRDQQFGPGCPPSLLNGQLVFNNTWQPSNGASNFSTPAGLDDKSNFYNLTLGTPP